MALLDSDKVAMVMDRGIRELSGMINGCHLGGSLSFPGAIDTLKLEDPEEFFNHNGLIDPPLLLPDAADGVPPPPASTSPQGYSPEDSEIFSDIALSYIAEILMEEEMDGGDYAGQEGPALQEAVKPFFDVLGETYPPSPDLLPLLLDRPESPEDSSSGHSGNSISSSSPGGSGAVDEGCFFDLGENPSSPQVDSSTNSNMTSSVLRAIEEALFRAGEEELQVGIQPMWQYNRGVEEAIKFLPDQQKLVIDLEAANSSSAPSHKDRKKKPPECGVAEVKVEEKEEKPQQLLNGPSRLNRKSLHHQHHDEELAVEQGRSTKQLAVFSVEDDDVPPEMFDKVLLCTQGTNDAITSLREALQNEVSKAAAASSSKNGGHSSSRGSGTHGGGGGGKSRGRRQPKKEVVDLRTLLIQCAQAVATDDRRSAGELLRQIRQHSSADGDGSQRLAHVFADGLEARLAGTGSELYHTLATMRQSTAAFLKAYHLLLAACPFRKVSHVFANQTILDAAEGAPCLHIVDLGILFGFQWPCLIQRLSQRPGGPPRLRITGIEFPQPGFRPAERIEETGRRLADYARRFGVPFEYRPIAAAQWEAITAEDLHIDREGEVLVVNCLYRLRNLADETVAADSPRDRVLRNIAQGMRPDVLVHAVVNGSYGAPFFGTRFREALFHFSALFDMLETTVPRERAQRKLIEREIFGREAMNVIACEGAERVERPETYKQWQARNQRAGLVQLPMNAAMMRKAKEKVRSCYHKDFLLDEDGGWLLQGWKGRICFALSTWRPCPPA